MAIRIYSTPIQDRPRLRSPREFLSASLFTLLFFVFCLSVHVSQWLFLPVRLFSQAWWDQYIRFTKGYFAVALIWMSQWFAPTEFIVTTEGEYFQTDGVIERDSNNCVTKINLPQNVVLIANHQVYLDWWYLWCLSYWMGAHKDVVIVLKKSLKWFPIIGWGMIWFRFIFLARSWAVDSAHFISQLAALGGRSGHGRKPFILMLFPEGTLVSSGTRPVSKKWADKTGVDDLTHTLLPRTTGLHYTLRAITPRVPDLHLLDVTVAYEGIPRGGYGQSYYTLRSVFLNGIPPPKIHMHLRLYNVKSDIPIGDVDVYNEKAPVYSRDAVEISQAESRRFEGWLLNLWKDKDCLLESHVTEGYFTRAHSVTGGGLSFTLPVKLRSNWEIFNGWGLLGPAFLVFCLKEIVTVITSSP